MRINAEFDQRVLLRPEDMTWIPSPMPGVDRKPLDRIGDEIARATSFVRYAPESAFSAHTHTGGEEYIVLEGVFQDEHGDFPKGAYVRNPPTSAHTPSSKPGAVIFVKLWQFDMTDRTQLHIDLNTVETAPDPDQPGVAAATLFEDARETVRLLALAPGATARIDAVGGAEALILAGAATENADTLGEHAWLRAPDGDRLALTAGPDGARIWVKTGHLRFVEAPAV